MKKMLAAMATVATVTFAGSALAEVDEGRIVAITSWSVQLDQSHQFFTAPDPSVLQGLKVGDKVRVTHQESYATDKQIVKMEKLPAQ